VLFSSITQVSADAFVSSDNNHLSMQAGVSRVILKAAGKQVRQEASKHIPLNIGDVAVTSGGKLAAKYIFHAVTTDLDTGRGPSEEGIQTATRKALELADALGVRRIVFPILGTGGGGFPLDIAAEVMAHAIAEHVMKETCIELVILTFPVFGRVQRIALTALNKHFAKLLSKLVQTESQ
jgi:O-acetyl-ADP-ribose deacetylase (regulator of RNase III)